MGNTTADTEWPSSQSLSEEKKLVLDSYFSLLDTPDPTNGAAIAGIFTPDGCIVGPAGKIQGSEKIQGCRQHAWDVIKQRSHKLTRVYVNDSGATDLMVIGTVVQGLANGKSISGDWAARFCLEQGPDSVVKIKLHHVFADFGGGQKAIQEALSSS